MPDDFANLSAILHDRYSCRAYLKQEVDVQTINEMVSAASRVPTWCNAQPWEVLVTRGQATAHLAEELIKAAEATAMEPDVPWPLEYTGHHLARRRACGHQLYEAVGIERGDAARRKQQMRGLFRLGAE